MHLITDTDIYRQIYLRSISVMNLDKPEKSHPWTNSSLGGNFWRTFRTFLLVHTDFPENKAPRDWSMRISPEIHMDQWLPNLSESSDLHPRLPGTRPEFLDFPEKIFGEIQEFGPCTRQLGSQRYRSIDRSSLKTVLAWEEIAELSSSMSIKVMDAEECKAAAMNAWGSAILDQPRCKQLLVVRCLSSLTHVQSNKITWVRCVIVQAFCSQKSFLEITLNYAKLC